MEDKTHKLLNEAHEKLDVIKKHLPKIIIAIVVVAVVVSVVHGYFGHANMLTSVD